MWRSNPSGKCSILLDEQGAVLALVGFCRRYQVSGLKELLRTQVCPTPIKCFLECHQHLDLLRFAGEYFRVLALALLAAGAGGEEYTNAETQR